MSPPTTTTPATPPPPWTKAQTIDLLNADPLPSTFTWPHADGGTRPVVPVHSTLRGGYGKWLAEGPSYSGLFELINDILADCDSCSTDSSWLACGPIVAGEPPADSWSALLVAEIHALLNKNLGQLTEAEPIAHQLRRLRRRPTDAADLF